MRRVGRLAGTVAVLAMPMHCCTAAQAEFMLEGRDQEKFLFFSGSDLWRHGSFTYGGLLWSPRGIDQEGFTFKALIGGGSYRYISGTLGGAEVQGQQVIGFALPGWRFRSGSVILTTFAGLDVQHHRLRPDDPGSKLRGTQAGFRVAVELWSEPTPTTMLAADASVTTVGPSYSARGAFGWKLFDSFYAGPEVQAFRGDDAYRQWRVGMHITGLKHADFEWSFGMGYADDSDDREGLYGRLGLLYRP